MTKQLEALHEEAAQIIGLLTATGSSGLVLDKAADFFDDMFRQLEASQLAVKLPRVAAVMWHLSDQAKHRTTAENVNDVLDAIRATGGKVQGGE